MINQAMHMFEQFMQISERNNLGFLRAGARWH